MQQAIVLAIAGRDAHRHSQRPTTPLTELIVWLQQKRQLLILDNAEQLAGDSALGPIG